MNNMTILESTTTFQDKLCPNATYIKDQVAQYCTGSLPRATIIVTAISLLFFIMLFFSLINLGKELNRKGLLNFQLGMSQFMLIMSDKSNKKKFKSFKNYTEVGNLLFFIGVLAFSTIIIVCHLALLILYIRAYL